MWRVLCVMWLCACTVAPDTSQPRANALNGNAYGATFGEPELTVDELEAGFNRDTVVSILFPLKTLVPAPNSGVTLQFIPSDISVGQDITLQAGQTQPFITVSFFPASGHDFSAGKLLFYDLCYDATGTIKFEQLDETRIKGNLLYAPLCGYYEVMEGGSAELTPPQKLELWNFAFDFAAKP